MICGSPPLLLALWHSALARRARSSRVYPAPGLIGRAYHFAMPPPFAGNAELERERARIEALFRQGWMFQGPGCPPAPARQHLPFIKGVGGDAEVIITGRGTRRCVAVLFCHQSFPGVRLGHRFTRADKHAPIWLMEEIETGALHRMMRAEPVPDEAGIIWTTWGTHGNI